MVGCLHQGSPREAACRRPDAPRDSFYLPLIERRHVYKGRRLRSQEPLFGSYVFLFTDPRERVQSLATNRIAQSLPVLDGPQLYDDLVQIRRLIEADVPLTVESRLRPGSACACDTAALRASRESWSPAAGAPG